MNLAEFVASLRIPDERKEVVLAELTDHVASGGTLDLEALRGPLEAVEPAFRIPRWQMLVRGIVAGVLVAIVIDQGGVMYGVIGALVTIAIACVCAPPRTLAMVRRELRVPRVPIGPALTYLAALYATPFLVWIAMMITRAILDGTTSFPIPWSAFALATAIVALVAVERVRRPVSA